LAASLKRAEAAGKSMKVDADSESQDAQISETIRLAQVAAAKRRAKAKAARAERDARWRAAREERRKKEIEQLKIGGAILFALVCILSWSVWRYGRRVKTWCGVRWRRLNRIEQSALYLTPTGALGYSLYDWISYERESFVWLIVFLGVAVFTFSRLILSKDQQQNLNHP